MADRLIGKNISNALGWKRTPPSHSGWVFNCNFLIDSNHTCAIIAHIQSEAVIPVLDEKALAPQRWDNLRALIRDRGVIRVEDLCRQLKVSAATVRRDLDQLERSGAIRRVHGGAVSLDS